MVQPSGPGQLPEVEATRITGTGFTEAGPAALPQRPGAAFAPHMAAPGLLNLTPKARRRRALAARTTGPAATGCAPPDFHHSPGRRLRTGHRCAPTLPAGPARSRCPFSAGQAGRATRAWTRPGTLPPPVSRSPAQTVRACAHRRRTHGNAASPAAAGAAVWGHSGTCCRRAGGQKGDSVNRCTRQTWPRRLLVFLLTTLPAKDQGKGGDSVRIWAKSAHPAQGPRPYRVTRRERPAPPAGPAAPRWSGPSRDPPGSGNARPPAVRCWWRPEARCPPGCGGRTGRTRR